ncbi:TlpA family protein disulfide reductase [Mucilaginibacter segetis]|uniref:TlpA family protein disulfide reductase n=1 Tax=Mucilaginibacter segetis TaxID=2793071 RepID=UPI001BE44206|nr:TlpA disulfide reductase family protein [Mucilaginibacter segetis]
MINFWASYCVPCRQENADLRQLYDKYKNKGFNIVSISIDENKDYWRQASRQDSIPWLNIAELTEQQGSKNIKNFAVKIIPSNYLIDSKGRIIAKDVSFTDLKKQVSENIE